MQVQGRTIRTTGEHPFYAEDLGWTACRDLRPGQRILSEASATWLTIERIAETDAWETVYNFRVADWHTYFVGGDDWGWALWAHNASYGGRLTAAEKASVKELTSQAVPVRDAIRNVRAARAVDAPSSVTAYRAQGRPLIAIDDAGNVSIARPLGRQRQGVAVHVGFDEGRAKVWITEKGRTEVVQFEVDKSFLERLRRTAQPEVLPPGVARDRSLPWRVDIDWPDQYAIPPSMLDDFEKAIIPGTGRVTRTGGLAMPSQEFFNLTSDQSREPECLGRTILAFPLGNLSAVDLLDRVKNVWKTVAGWGTWRDDELGEWPSDDECVKRLPDWFQRDLERHPTFSLQAWISDLHDRDWIWSSGRVVDGCVKIDLDSQSLPVSTWMLEVVVESTGGRVVYRDNWISDDDAIAIAESKDNHSNP